MMCNCIDIQNSMLWNNYRISVKTTETFHIADKPHLDSSAQRKAIIANEQYVESNPKNIPEIIAIFCPFCGEKYENEN